MEFLPDTGDNRRAQERRPRRNHTAAFKAKVALAAVKGDRTIAWEGTSREAPPYPDLAKVALAARAEPGPQDKAPTKQWSTHCDESKPSPKDPYVRRPYIDGKGLRAALRRNLLEQRSPEARARAMRFQANDNWLSPSTRSLSPKQWAGIVIDNTAHPSFRPALRDYFDRARKSDRLDCAPITSRSTPRSRHFSRSSACLKGANIGSVRP